MSCPHISDFIYFFFIQLDANIVVMSLRSSWM